ncbi:MAG TPA: hypothetical protein DCM62_02040 [Bacteroidales bacterium]|nr:hypothetical protein [Bacteroidales bacterium]
MKKIIRTLLASLVLIALGLTLPSCEQESLVYDGPPVVEFSNFSWGLALSTAAQPHYAWVGTGAHWSTEIRGVRPDTSIQVQLIGPHHPHDLTLSYRVADTVFRLIARNIIVTSRPTVLEDGTPAVVLRDFVVIPRTATPEMFTVLNNGNITIPANSSFGRLRIGLNPATIPLPVTTTRDLWLVLEPGTVAPAENYRVFRLRIRNL